MILSNLNSTTWGGVLISVFLAALFGFILGLDRDAKNKPIDFRAYIIVCVATCIISIMALEIPHMLVDNETFLKLDVGKIIAGVLTGIGFLGAGAIIKRDNDQVVGTATGASIWAAGAIGLCLGFGFYALATLAFVVVYATLFLGGKFMENFQDKSDHEQKP